MERYGGRCAWVDGTTGVRCTCTVGLEAHHAVPLAQGGTNAETNAVLLCRRHHRLAERAARAS